MALWELLAFHPGRTLTRRPSDAGLPFEDVRIETDDHVALHGWWIPPPGRNAHALVLAHGNAGTVADRLDSARVLRAAGLGVLLFDYRGYGLSEGKPSEEGLYLDGLAALRAAQQRHDPGKIALFGRSLGGAVMVEVALRLPRPVPLVLESTFTSLADLVDHLHKGMFFRRWLLRGRFDVIGRAPKLKGRLLVMHGEHDDIVPFEQGRRVYEVATCEKRLYVVPGAGHDDTYDIGGPAYIRAVTSFLAGA